MYRALTPGGACLNSVTKRLTVKVTRVEPSMRVYVGLEVSFSRVTGAGEIVEQMLKRSWWKDFKRWRHSSDMSALVVAQLRLQEASALMLASRAEQSKAEMLEGRYLSIVRWSGC